jgi:outer membrane protein assembly factor BamB
MFWSDRRVHPLSEKYLRFSLLMICSLTLVAGAIWLGRQALCFNHTPTLAIDLLWSIDDQYVQSVQILWQLRETSLSSAQLTSDLVVSNGTVLYPTSQQVSGLCGNVFTILALDLQTGRQLWHYRPEQIPSQYFSVRRGFLLTGGGTVFELSPSGIVHWRQEIGETQFPFRTLVQVVEGAEQYFVLAPQHDLYTINSLTGRSSPNNLAQPPQFLLNDFTVYLSDENVLTFTPLPNTDAAIPIEITVPADISISSIDLQQQDSLLILSDADTIHAVDLSNGAFLWTITRPFADHPLILGDHFILYSTGMIEVYDLATGVSMGRIHLITGTAPSISENDVLMVGEGDVVVIRFPELGQIVALKLD